MADGERGAFHSWTRSGTSETCEQAAEIRRDRRFGANPPPSQWVVKVQTPRMKHHALGATTSGVRSIRRVDALAKNRMTELLEVKPDLMLPAGFELQFEQRRFPKALAHAIVRHRMSAFLGAPDDAAPARDVAIGDARFDGALVALGNSVDQREIPTLEFVRGKQRAASRVGLAR